MAAIQNEIDRILQAAPSRYSNPPNAAILLTASAPMFHITAGGAHDPASITFTATLVALAGTVTFNVTGGTLSIAGNVATLTYENMPGVGASVWATFTENGQTYTSNVCYVTKISDGAPGEGTTTYTWIKYADSAAGAGLSDSPTGKRYLGIATNKSTITESTNPTDYVWSLMTGEDGVPGAPGANGVTLYTWIAYSDLPDGTGLYQTPTDDTLYIGIAPNNATATESSNKTDYVWSRFKGGQGVPGVGSPGARGAGHFYATGAAWSDSAADAATPGGNVVDDRVTISNGTFVMTKYWTGSAWTPDGAVIDGNLIVTNSITAAKINSNGLTVRAPDGTIILDASGLNATYAAPGTKNSDQTLGALGYTGSLNATSETRLFASTNILLQGNAATKTAGAGWGEQVISAEGYSGGAFVSAVVMAGTLVFGLNSDPNSNASFDTIDYGIYADANGDIHRWLNGSSAGVIGTWAAGDALSIQFSGTAFQFFKNGALLTSVPSSSSAIYYFDSSFLTIGAKLTNIRFGPMSNTAEGATALAAANAANDALANKLNKNSDDILGSVLSINAVTAPAGFRAGSLTWNNSGTRTGGYGVAMTPQGLISYNAGGTLTFFINASTGAAYFGGELMAVTGSFGSVTIATGGSIRSGQTAYDTGNGFFLGDVSGNPKLSMKTPNGAKLLCDPANNILQLTGATINNPTMDTMTVTGFNDIILSGRPNTSALTYFGTLTASTTGGVAPYTYTWTLSTAHGNNLVLSAATGASVDVKARSINNAVEGYATCTSTDSNGRAATRTSYISIGFGAA